MIRKPAGTSKALQSLCDVSFWLALSLGSHAHHTAASEWFEQIEEEDALLFCRATQQSFLRLLTTASITGPYSQNPLTDREAWQAYDALLADYRIGLGAEPAGAESEWRKCTQTGQVSPKRWMDAYLAAYCVAGGYRFVTFDSAFRSDPRLDVLVLR
jgi:uncharacterized protein